MPVIAPALKASSRPPASEPIAACAVRTLARTETFMPMKPAAPERTAPMAKPTATSQPRSQPTNEEDDDADDADGGVLALEIGLRAFAHRGGDLLHLGAAGIGLQHRRGRPDAVNDREQSTKDDQPQSCHGILDNLGGPDRPPPRLESGA